MMPAQDGTIRVIAIGAHPDDGDYYAAGAAARWAARGHAVKFVSLTNGDAGHHSEGGGALGKRRRAEAEEAGRRLGVAEYEILDYHDGELLPTLEARGQVIRRIRQWNADLVLTHRPNDYHADHRYTGVLVADAAFLVTVPNICPDTAPLRKNPVFLYFQDDFQTPVPFRPDIAVAIDEVWEKKIEALDAHVSQFYEWLPWLDGKLSEVPEDPGERKSWLARGHRRAVTPAVRAALEEWYGGEKASQVRHAEAFEICEYGRQVSEAELRTLFPMVK
jgi:LmbE family N-acetylglucosaminyl deacetylase